MASSRSSVLVAIFLDVRATSLRRPEGRLQRMLGGSGRPVFERPVPARFSREHIGLGSKVNSVATPGTLESGSSSLFTFSQRRRKGGKGEVAD